MDFGKLIDAVETDSTSGPSQQSSTTDFGKLIDAVEIGSTSVPSQQSKVGQMFGINDNIPNPNAKSLEQPSNERVNRDGTISTISTGPDLTGTGSLNENVVKPTKEYGSQLLLGARRDITLPLVKMVDDAANFIGIPLPKEGELKLKIANDLIKQYEDKHPDELIHPATMGGFTAAILATAPAGMWNTAIKAAASSGVLAGLSELGKSGDYENAAEQSAFGAAFGYITTGAVNKLVDIIDSKFISDKNANKLYNYILNHYGISKEEADKTFQNWSKINKSDGRTTDKIKAVIDNLGERGAQAKNEAAASSPSATSQIMKEMNSRKKLIDDLANTDNTIGDVAAEVQKQANVVKNNYGKLVDKIAKQPINTKGLSEIPEALDEATTGNAKAIKELLGNEDVTAKDLVDSMPIINEMVSKTRGKTKYKWKQLADSVDAKLRESLDPKLYNQWKEVNRDYARMSNAVNSNIGQTIMRVLGKVGKKETLTPEAAMQTIKRLTGGKDTFEDLKWLVGGKTAGDLEKLIVKEALGKGSEEVDWAHLARTLEKKGFVTTGGKELQNLIYRMRDTFATDDKLRDIWFRNNGLSAGMSDSLLAKIRFSIVGELFKKLVKHIPGNETSLHIRMMDELQKVLKSPTEMRKFEAVIDKTPSEVKDKIIEDTIKQIEYKPDAKTTINSGEKLYATEKGTVAKNPSEAALQDATTTLQEHQMAVVRNSLKDIKDDKVFSQIDKIVIQGNHRIKNVVRDITKQFKKGEADYNARLLKKRLDFEVNELVKRINKEVGVRLPKSEVEKIYKLKLHSLVEDCK